jgi:hypothetical protein
MGPLRCGRSLTAAPRPRQHRTDKKYDCRAGHTDEQHGRSRDCGQHAGRDRKSSECEQCTQATGATVSNQHCHSVTIINCTVRARRPEVNRPFHTACLVPDSYCD